MTFSSSVNENHIAIIGAGTMGSGIAQKYASHGFRVSIIDKSLESLEVGKKHIEDTLEQAVARGIFKPDRAEIIKHGMTFSTDLSDCSNATLVVEAITENLKAKRQLFKSLEDHCKIDTTLATNTSSFLVSKIQEGLKYPERVIGLHYFFHPAKNRLVELIGSSISDCAHLKRAESIQNSINKMVIKSADSPGFIVNRFFVPWLNESMRIVHEGRSNIKTVDQAAKEFFNIAMGPFELMNVTGPMVTLHACQSLAKSLGPFYAPCPLITSQMKGMQQFEISGEVDERKFKMITNRLLAVVSAVSSKMVLEEKVCEIADADLGARVGLLWKKGPFELTNDNLSDNLNDTIENICTNHDDFPATRAFRANIKNKTKFPSSRIICKVSDGIGNIKLNCPDTLNALNEDLKEELNETFTRMSQDSMIRGIILSGHPRSFMAGADLAFFDQNLALNQIDRIIEFAKSSQQLFTKIDQCKKPVVAAVSGVALGGGLELALACDRIVATHDARLGFPETGIGIYPGLGGTQRTPIRIGVELARFLILSGTILNGRQALAIGLIDDCVESSSLTATARSMIESYNNTPPSKERAEYDELIDIRETFEKPYDPNTQPIDAQLSDRCHKAILKIKEKAPIAIHLAEKLIQQANPETLSLGLELESQYLKRVFSSDDARIGISSAMKKKAAKFSGK